jgi:hypothetical protein
MNMRRRPLSSARIGWTRSSAPNPRKQAAWCVARFADVEREVGRDALELAVRRRGFHMIECDRDFVIICSGPDARHLLNQSLLEDFDPRFF